MKTAHSVLTLICVISLTCTHAKIGYFWHITDFHFDPLYTSQGDTRRHCRRADERGSSGHHRALGRYGDYACDSSLELIESAARYMRTRHSENVEFVLWTGDIITAHIGNEEERFQAIRNMTDLLGRTFSSHFVFPVLGHLDPSPSESLTNLWMQWLPLEALETFKIGGYYMIEQKQSKLRIIVLNTNLFNIRESNSAHARSQWDWLHTALDKATTNKDMVYIVGHAAPGSDFQHPYASSVVAPEANARYLRMVRRHSKIIVGQFFGHLHADTFRVIYDNDRPVSWALMSPSVSPHRDSGDSSNPGLRLYKFDTNTGKVLDYTQYYLDLGAANRNQAEWSAEYNLTQYYGLHEVSAISLHNLAEKLQIGTPHETNIFHKYIRAYKVRHESTESCDGACAHQHFCAITCLDHVTYRHCVEAAASALAAAGLASSLTVPILKIVFSLFMFLVFTF